MTKNRLNQTRHSMFSAGRWNNGARQDASSLAESMGNLEAIESLRKSVIQRPGAAILAGLVVGGILGWLTSRIK